jgi:hypothetical protein
MKFEQALYSPKPNTCNHFRVFIRLLAIFYDYSDKNKQFNSFILSFVDFYKFFIEFSCNKERILFFHEKLQHFPHLKAQILKPLQAFFFQHLLLMNMLI